MAEATKTAAKGATKTYKVTHNILAAAPMADDADEGTRRLRAYKLYRPGDSIELNDVDAAQQAKLGHIEVAKK